VPQHIDLTLDWVLRVSPTDTSHFQGPRVACNHFLKVLVLDNATVALHLTVKSDFMDKSPNYLATMYILPNFTTLLQAYITTTCDDSSRFQARLLKGWLKFRIQLQSQLRPGDLMPSQQVQALPPLNEHPFGKCDVVLVRSGPNSKTLGEPSSQTTCGHAKTHPPDVVQVRTVFTLSPRGSLLPVELSMPLLYMQHFALTGTPADQPDIGMFNLHHRYVNNPDGSIS